MKRLVMFSLLALAISSSTGCCLFDRVGGCQAGYPMGGEGAACGPACASARRSNPTGALSRLHSDQRQPSYESQPTGQIAYPYYTTRGPRDFLTKNPQDIGPY